MRNSGSTFSFVAYILVWVVLLYCE